MAGGVTVSYDGTGYPAIYTRLVSGTGRGSIVAIQDTVSDELECRFGNCQPCRAMRRWGGSERGQRCRRTHLAFTVIEKCAGSQRESGSSHQTM